ncbi:MAG: SiaB family protein kinase [Bacteroidia bacterium]|nr:SiaB family protein kinase [Bacteroidia bacterium]
MAVPDMYKLFRQMEEGDIILSFKGAITKELLSSIYDIMESRLDQTSDEPQRKKKFYHILVESLQNIFHHMERINGDEGGLREREAMFMVGYTVDNGYRILTGNFIRSEEVIVLEEKLKAINAMNQEELREHYRSKLSTTELSDRGGAGLGFIDMARKSGQKLEFSFQAVEPGFHFFTFSVTIK